MDKDKIEIVVDHLRIDLAYAPHAPFITRKDGYVAIIKDGRKRCYTFLICKIDKEPVMTSYVS